MNNSKNLVPGLKPGRVTYEYYEAYTPEKIELVNGLLIGDEEQVKKLLLLLMYNIGLVETVKLVPTELWEQALKSIK